MSILKRIIPDDYYNDGFFEIARFGNVVESINHMSPDVHVCYLNGLAEKHDEIKVEVEQLILKIRASIRKAEPSSLINYLITMNQMIMINKTSESEFSDEENMQMRCVEYVQSILVSEKEEGQYDSEDESLFGQILCDIIELYNKMLFFYIYWGSKTDLPIDEDERKYIVFSQLMSNVRGNQYQIFRIPILKELLFPYEKLINEAYGVSANLIISGLEVLEKNLSSGRLDALKNLSKQMDMLDDYAPNDLPEDYVNKSRKYVMQAVGLDLFDVKKSTNWPDNLINDLALGIGEDNSFLTEGDYSGWPIRTVPIKMKPFIRLGGCYYCFDYYNFFDNFYKAFRKVIVNRISNGTERWNDIQGHASEKMVADVFEKILPGATIHLGNYYPFEKESAENDILIEYRDVLLIVEVKAGAFTPSPAISDYQSHVVSLKNLVAKAEMQALRVKQYIESSEAVYFYDGNDLKNITFPIRKGNYSQIYMFDVTLADFNDIAAQMEKIKIADTKEDVIVLSVNDLWVYNSYFDSPIQFIHYIKQRMLATRVKAMSISDELDHLGLYIDKNMYSLGVSKIKSGGHVRYSGYREELDKYFSLLHLGMSIEKPKQKLTKEINTIITICNNSNLQYMTRFTNFLLDMSEEAREIFSDSIAKIAVRELELGRMISASCFGDFCYVLFVKQPDIEHFDIDQQRQYALATIAKNRRDYIFRIEVILDSWKNIIDIDYDYFTQEDIREDERNQLVELGEEYSKKRMQNFLVQNQKKKIYPNDYCPCGSGKKYKKCCGR